MSGFIAEASRSQTTLFPESLDDYIDADNPVRVIDVFVSELDLQSLGFDRIDHAQTGRPGYHPSTLLKLYIYGYLNRIQSSRRLERESRRNLELIWLIGRLSPDFKTIADFRRDNGSAIKKVCAQLVVICKNIGMFNNAALVIDGSKFKAVNSKDNNYTASKLKARMEQTEKRIARYLDDLDYADRRSEVFPKERVDHLQRRLTAAVTLLERLKDIEQKLPHAPDKQISMTDPDSRAMATSGKGTGLVGYNVQTTVDDQHHLIVAHEVTMEGHDRAALASMTAQGKAATGLDKPVVYADRGYYSGEQILAVHKSGAVPMVPKSRTSGAKKQGRFDKRDFIYIPQDDEFECPAGERAIFRFERIEAGQEIKRYWSSACIRCAIKDRCTPSDYRRISRLKYEDILDEMQDRVDAQPEASKIRRRTVEHPFGTIKSWMGATHFLTRTKHKVATEMSLHVLAYNLKRLIAIFGVTKLQEIVRP